MKTETLKWIITGLICMVAIAFVAGLFGGHSKGYSDGYEQGYNDGEYRPNGIDWDGETRITDYKILGIKKGTD